MVSACRLIAWQVLDLSVYILFFPYLYLKVQRTGCKSLLWHSYLHPSGWDSQDTLPVHHTAPSCSGRNILFSFNTMNSIFFLEMMCIFCFPKQSNLWFFYRIYSIKFIFCKMSYSVDVIYNDVHHLFPRV